MSDKSYVPKPRDLTSELKRIENRFMEFFWEFEILKQVFFPYLKSDDLFTYGEAVFERIVTLKELDVSWHIDLNLLAGVKYSGIDLPPNIPVYSNGIDIYCECFMRLVLNDREHRFRIVGRELIRVGLSEDLCAELTRYSDSTTLYHLGVEIGGLQESLRSFIYSGFKRKFINDVTIGAYSDPRHLFWLSNTISALINLTHYNYGQFLSRQSAIQKLQCVIFDIAMRIHETKSFAKSPTLQNIREDLERKSKEIIAEVNR